ncbi:hypothetical protein NDA11_001854 [Ustilago hordei]|uniref:Uncharacterized protein n=1 Tax=Ustilago hordei TaxID=120017 RepID=I2FYS5_USTHO|nr:uncharacterized protein UHO2_03854 [Ustilago hordei]KAJ1037471.1 hypothetical protein NDA10_003485 [Ustilago hordei]KAJ1580130.1 hypothetical protein NDA15_006998 [Ustilago hordei]KAJ1581830.1 hypothetical protein NDA12_003469 [Ustilago hordei]KAJ1582371.1 hypothetical protein NDA11_001854 [Ustilago hordei]KAJ1600261.1 hypothetical protein NDA14_004781 [Ustilago hordei]
MKNEAPQLKNEGIDLLKEEKEVKKEAQHILTHVLANAGYGSISRELGGILAREGFFIRNTKAYSNDAPSSLRSPAKTPSPSKASAESPSKRKRVAKKGDADE